MKITKDHVKLAKRMYVRWEDCEYGAPSIDCKRPYGNSDVEGDVAEILGWPVDEDDGLTAEQSKEAARLHREMLGVIRVLLANADLVVGKAL